MLLLITGSSCSGKTTVARACGDLDALDVHDSDEHGVPSDADTAWRQRDLEQWLRHAVEQDGQGVDVLLTGQSPLRELLAVPSAAELDLAVCLLDVDDRTRWRRLDRRDPGQWSTEQKRAFIGWARWHRAHAADPNHHPEVLTTGAWPGMQWHRTRGWTAEDPRWHVDVVDSTARTVEQTAADVRQWITRVRDEGRAGTLPLQRGALSRPGDSVGQLRTARTRPRRTSDLHAPSASFLV